MNAKATSEGVLGVSFASGVAYLALVHKPSDLRLDSPARLLPPTNLDRWPAVKQFGARLVADALAHQVVAVAFAEPRKYSAWKYYDAFDRAALQTAGSLALVDSEIAVHAVAQKTACKTLGLGLGDLDQDLATKLGLDPAAVTYWKQRIPAVAVALHLARMLWQ